MYRHLGVSSRVLELDDGWIRCCVLTYRPQLDGLLRAAATASARSLEKIAGLGLSQIMLRRGKHGVSGG